MYLCRRAAINKRRRRRDDDDDDGMESVKEQSLAEVDEQNDNHDTRTTEIQVGCWKIEATARQPSLSNRPRLLIELATVPCVTLLPCSLANSQQPSAGKRTRAIDEGYL